MLFSSTGGVVIGVEDHRCSARANLLNSEYVVLGVKTDFNFYGGYCSTTYAIHNSARDPNSGHMILA